MGELAASHYDAIERVMREVGRPLGAEQIADYCGIDAYQVRKRLPEMKALAEVVPGHRRTRSGRFERLWGIKAS